MCGRYTWTKRPFHFRPKAEPFAFAGVYDVWKGDGGSGITSFSIVTTDAASSTSRYHHRMRSPPEIASDIMKPYGGRIDAWEVDNAVGGVRNNRPDLMERAALL